MGFALLYRGAGFCLRRAETGKAGMFRPFFVSCVESAKGSLIVKEDVSKT